VLGSVERDRGGGKLAAMNGETDTFSACARKPHSLTREPPCDHGPQWVSLGRQEGRMFTSEVTVQISRPLDEVFTYVADASITRN